MTSRRPAGVLVAASVLDADLGALGEEIRRAEAAGADRILLDNMSPGEMREAVVVTGGRAKLEASGGMMLEGARAAAATGVDAVSVGALTHSAPALDLGLDIDV